MNKARKRGWTEDQVKATVQAYFKLLEKQDGGIPVNKKAIYDRLASKFPQRSSRAFESKFQNISAILYEENLPYCDGLKPRFNYQNLLKLVVLDCLKRNPLPALEPHQILFGKLIGLRKRGYLPVVGRGTGRFGLTIEHHLGIPPNSDKHADFMGIELKTKHSNTLQTLFSRVPTRFKGCKDKAELVAEYGYPDKKTHDRTVLYTSFNNSDDSLGFSLDVQDDRIEIHKDGKCLLEYSAETLEAALLSKHSQTVFVNLSIRRNGGVEECRPESAMYCKWPSIIRFLRLIRQGKVYLDFTLSQKNGRVKDHGFLWRIRTEALPELYLSSEERSLA